MLKLMKLKLTKDQKYKKLFCGGNADFKKEGSPVAPNALMACTGPLFLTFQLLSFTQNIAGLDSEVGVVSLRAGNPGMASRWGRDFSHHSKQALGPIQLSTQ
jgi:hypothetical protein